MSDPKFATFWEGGFSPMEIACIASYRRHGYDIVIYSYTPLEGLPVGMSSEDASLIAPREAMKKFIFAGKPNLSHFSDYFRYLLFKKTDRIWVDADMLLLRPFDQALPQTLLAREWQPSICGAVMRIDRNDGHLDRLISATEAAAGKELLWGETGPLLLTREFGKAALLNQAFGAERFYAIDHDDFWKVFLPEYAAECRQRTAKSWGAHLWNNIVDALGYWKDVAPPKHSFLADSFEELDVMSSFKDVYPEAVMRRMINNFRLRKTGEDLGIRQLVTQIVPSVGRTIRHYRKG